MFTTREYARQAIAADLDLPILASEFHFGAVDRGVRPGLSSGIKGRAFPFYYLSSALANLDLLGSTGFSGSISQLRSSRPGKTSVRIN